MHDPVVRLDDDPEGVHQTRVAHAQAALRPADIPVARGQGLRVVRCGTSSAGSPTSSETVRDGDVLLERLRARVDVLPETEQHGAPAPCCDAAKRSATSPMRRSSRRSQRALRDAARQPRRGGERACAPRRRGCAGRGGRPAPRPPPVAQARQARRRRWATSPRTRSCTRSGSGRSACATRRRPPPRSWASRHGSSPSAAAELQDVLGELNDARRRRGIGSRSGRATGGSDGRAAQRTRSPSGERSRGRALAEELAGRRGTSSPPPKLRDWM